MPSKHNPFKVVIFTLIIMFLVVFGMIWIGNGILSALAGLAWLGFWVGAVCGLIWGLNKLVNR